MNGLETSMTSTIGAAGTELATLRPGHFKTTPVKILVSHEQRGGVQKKVVEFGDRDCGGDLAGRTGRKRIKF